MRKNLRNVGNIVYIYKVPSSKNRLHIVIQSSWKPEISFRLFQNKFKTYEIIDPVSNWKHSKHQGVKVIFITLILFCIGFLKI
jgi:hypothetical protein